MEEVKQDVAEVVPAQEDVVEKDVNTVQEASPEPQPQEPQDDVVPSAPEVKQELPKDNRPPENAYWETKRKLDEIYPLVNELREVIPNLRNIRPQEEPVKPTKDQLIYWKTLTSDPQELARIDIELEKSRSSEMRELIENSQKKASEHTMAEVKRNSSIGWVGQNMPQCFQTDPMGNKSWDTNSPLTQRIFQYMQNPTLAKDPKGLLAAAKMAAFDMGVSMNLQSKVQRTVGQLRKEQKKQLASSGGTRTTETPESVKNTKYEKMKETYSKTGDRDVFAELLKMRGSNPFAK